MKLFTSFSRTYTKGYEITNPIHVALQQLDSFSSLNGVYTAHPDYVKQSKLGVFENDAVLTWTNAMQDGNYLYSITGNTESSPRLIENDPLFNNNPSIDFPDSGNTSLRFKFPIEVGTVFIIYMTRDNTSYLIFAPRETFAQNQQDRAYYDAFTPGVNGSLWASQSIPDNFNNHVYLADSRINGNSVSPDTFIIENVARLLCVSNFNTPNNKESISGFGGRRGRLGGSENPVPLIESKSVCGKIAAIVTYQEVLTESQIEQVEQILLDTYINYSGAVLTEDVRLKGVIGVPFTYDFAPVTLDEFYGIASWELVSPLDIGLSFVGSVLQGTPSRLLNSNITIKVTNTNGDEFLFDIPTFLCRRDPILSNVPQLNNVELVLSSGRSLLDNGTYGVITGAGNSIIEWDDARRLVGKSLNRQLVNSSIPNIFHSVPTYLTSDSAFNNQAVVNFASSNRLQTNRTNPFQAQTFLWVYYQPNYGTRQLLDTFPDIKGTGELWSIAEPGQVHGTTPVTALNTRVHKVPVNTLSFRLPTGTVYFITAKSTTGLISFKGFQGLFGKLAFFCSWTTLLSDAELINFIPFLTNRYYSDFSPFIFSQATEFRYASPIAVDLKLKVVDLRNELLSYNIVQNNYSATIGADEILRFSTTKDETLDFSIEVTNTSMLTSVLNFKVETILKTDPLYLDIRNNFSNVNAFYIGLNETITYSSTVVANWADYRNNGQVLVSTSATSINKYELDNKLSINFNLDGSTFFEIVNPETILGKCFILGYIRKEGASGRSLLFGQDNTSDFISGLDGIIWDTSSTSSAILNGTTYVNGRAVPNNYLIRPEVLNTIVINTTSSVSFDTIAKDRAFTDRSVKGFIPFICVLQENVSSDEAKFIDTAIRNYYDAAKKIIQLPFDNNLNDIGDRSKVVTGPLQFDTTFKFGGHSKLVAQNNSIFGVNIPNNSDFAYLTNDFTISFWLFINNSLGGTDRLSLYSQSDLHIFIQGNTLYVSRTTFISGQLASYTIPSSVFSSNTFHLVQLGRKDGICYFFFNGNLIASYPDTFEYFDYNSPVVLGSGNLVSTGAIRVLMDDFVVFRRTCLNTSSFVPPSSPY